MPVEATLGKASVAIRATLDKLDGDLSDARGKVDNAVSRIAQGAGKRLQQIGTMAVGGIGVATGAVAGLGAALGKITVDAAPVQGIADAFEGMAESAGYSQDEMVDALKRGSSGMISQRDLMMSFNKAAQLVSTDFATQLPDAMQYLSKVSAATGEDMGFMLDSLVTGVGRLSPMILDNLGIQVSQAEAVERAAEMYGVQASELDKAQTQAGMMNVVLEKLAANTESMPDVTESAAARMAQFKATMQDTKDQIGVALLPVLATLMTTLGKLAESVLPPLTALIENTLAPALQLVADIFGGFIGRLQAGYDPLTALQATFLEFLPPDLAMKLIEVTTNISEFIARVREMLDPIMQWISENVELKDVLIGLGIAVLSVVIPALLPIIGAIAGVIAVFAAVTAAVALVRAAWESNFLGIRDIAANVWGFIQTFVPQAIQTVQEIITSVVTAIQEFWASHGDQILTKAQAVWTSIQTAISTAIATIQSIIQTAVTAIQSFWQAHGQAISTVAQTTWDTITTWIQTSITVITSIITAFTAAIRGDWTAFGEHLRTAADAIWNNIQTIFQNAISNIITIVSHLVQQIGASFRNTDWGAVGRAVIDGIARGISGGVGAITGAARSAAQAALDAAKGFLGIHSPSTLAESEIGEPYSLGLGEGIQSAIPDVVRAARHTTQAMMDAAKLTMRNGARQAIAVPAGGGAGSYQIINHFGPDSIRSEEDIYRLAEQIDRSLELRGLRRSID